MSESINEATKKCNYRKKESCDDRMRARKLERQLKKKKKITGRPSSTTVKEESPCSPVRVFIPGRGSDPSGIRFALFAPGSSCAILPATAAEG